MRSLLWLLPFTCLVKITLQTGVFNGFDDSILFHIHWPGFGYKETLEEDIEKASAKGINKETITVTSSHNEQYKCSIPNMLEKESSAEDKYEGKSGLELISPLFSQSSCTYRSYTYWTYEVCHGRSVRQYHEDREGKKVKVQSYILGKWDKGSFEKMLLKEKQDEEQGVQKKQIPVKKVENINLPYLEVLMENGTLCELNNNKPRTTRVLYVCYSHGINEIFSLKETSTCQYEIIILSPQLCSHPKYKPKEAEVNRVVCVPLNKETRHKPYNLIKLNAESSEMRKHSPIDLLQMQMDLGSHVDLDISELSTSKAQKQPKLTDPAPVESFLLGKTCLNGGIGWWKYEFCYGRSVEQYHTEPDTSKISIRLGTFNKEKHLEWLKTHPHKRPKPVENRKYITHFYSDGSVCDKTGKPRQTEVKLKCLENPTSLSAVSLYLVEPRYCEYILGVESPLICDILHKADEDGLVPLPQELPEN